jgi:ADP-ribosylglycohydrolase
MTIEPVVPVDVLDRARGALLGQLVGDALGTTVEFESAAAIAARYPGGLREIRGGGLFSVRPGQVTDDGELALALARCLVAVGRYDPDQVAAAYLAWCRSGPFDIGSTTKRAFGGRVQDGPGLARRLEARASTESQANGALMRVSPLAIFGWALPADELAALGAQDARLSHPHPHCQAANVVFTHAIARALRGASRDTVYTETMAFAAARPALAWARDVLRAAGTAPPDEFERKQGWVRIALQNAFYRLRHAPSVEDGLVATVAAGGDTDTNAAIAGALLGAVHGESGIPARWRDAVLGCRTDRGPTYQTTDARGLAEALVMAGRRAGRP